jgi:hypothetical protein
MLFKIFGVTRMSKNVVDIIANQYPILIIYVRLKTDLNE